ncbi:MAG: MFS transporter [Deltaproteobacteria bacterium]|nr:MFS transporter [Deltaproteobacteria bacterium]
MNSPVALAAELPYSLRGSIVRSESLAKIDSTQTLAPSFAGWGRLAANSMAHMVEHLFNGVIAVILPLITTSLGLTLAQAGALASARTFMAGAASFPSGLFADLARRRNLLLGLCLGMIGLGSLGLSAASSFPVLLIFMALGGAGGGGFHPQSLAILSAAYREKRAFALGVHDSSANLAEVIGPLALGLLIAFVDWRTALQIWAIPGLVLGVLYALLGAEDSAAAPQRRDYRRALWEDVFKNKTVFSLVAVSTLRAMGQTALSAFLPLYLSLHLKLSAGAAGAYMSLLFFFAGIAPAFVGWISDRMGRKSLIAVFSFLSVAVIVAVPFLAAGPLLATAFAALGALLWALRPVIITAAMEAVPQNLAGSIVAVIFGANMGVSFLAPLMAGVVADAYGLPAALVFISAFPLLAAVMMSLFFKPANPR